MKFHKQKMLQNVVVSYSMNIAGNEPGHWERHLLLATAAPSCGDFFHFTPCPCLKEILPAQWLMLSTVASLLYKKKQKSFGCTLCNFSCTTAGKLETHKLTHSGEKQNTTSLAQQVATSNNTWRHILEKNLLSADSVTIPAQQLVTSRGTC